MGIRCAVLFRKSGVFVCWCVLGMFVVLGHNGLGNEAVVFYSEQMLYVAFSWRGGVILHNYQLVIIFGGHIQLFVSHIVTMMPSSLAGV